MKTHFLKYWVVVVIAITSAYGVQLLLLSENTRMSYQLGKERRLEKQLKADRDYWKLEAATGRRLDRIEAIARAAGMDVAKQVIPMGSAAPPQHAQLSGSGR